MIVDISVLCNLIDERKEELFLLLSELIKINSENFSSHGNEEECSRYIYNLCQDMGLESELFSPIDLEGFEKHPDYFPGRNLENRYNVVARWRGVENEDELMLMAHEDTVEIGEHTKWNFPPLSGEMKDGKIFGRGACDDKYAIATALFVIKLLKEQGFVPKANLLFAAYSDEEHGGSHGAMAVVMKYPCNQIISMDGREGQIWHCASGGQEVKYVYHVAETVANAELAARAIPIILDTMKSFADNRRREMKVNPFYVGTIIPETSFQYMGVRAGNGGMDLGSGEVIFEYYTDKCKEDIYTELAELELVLARSLAQLGIIGDGFIPNTRFFHYAYCKPDSEDITCMLEAAREATGKEPIVCGSCLSDLSVISKYGSNRAFGFGAGREFSKPGGSHQPNEYIECDKLVDYAKTIAAYVVKTLGVSN